MSFFSSFSTFSTRLRSIWTNEPLTKFSFFLILLLDIFIFSMIFQWISENTRILDTPDSYAGYNCRELLRTGDADDVRTRVLSVLQNTYTSSYSYSYDTYGNAPGCTTMKKDIVSIKENQAISSLINQMQNTEEKIRGIQIEQNNISSQYDTMLLEKIAKQERGEALTPTSSENAKTQIGYLSGSLGVLRSDLLTLQKQFDTHPLVQKLASDILLSRDTTENTYNSLLFWYPIKRFAIEILFILPLLFVTIWWSNRSIRKNNGLQLLISTHLLAIIALFVLLKVLEFIYDIIPHTVFERIYTFLLSSNIIWLLYYLFIFLWIWATMAIIYIVQKKIFSKERLEAKRADKWECYICGEKIHLGNTHCIRCGISQEKTCPHCSEVTHMTSDYCGKCGKGMEK